MIELGNKPIANVLYGDMGVKRILLGDKEVYFREGGYVYLKLETEGETDNG